jgi:hypothetical protein
MIQVIRGHFADSVVHRPATTIEFKKEEDMSALLSFCQENARDVQIDNVSFGTDWNEIEGELAVMEDEVKSSLTVAFG